MSRADMIDAAILVAWAVFVYALGRVHGHDAVRRAQRGRRPS